jgi:hypothetical protein
VSGVLAKKWMVREEMLLTTTTVNTNVPILGGWEQSHPLSFLKKVYQKRRYLQNIAKNGACPDLFILSIRGLLRTGA